MTPRSCSPLRSDATVSLSLTITSRSLDGRPRGRGGCSPVDPLLLIRGRETRGGEVVVETGGRGSNPKARCFLEIMQPEIAGTHTHGNSLQRPPNPHYGALEEGVSAARRCANLLGEACRGSQFRSPPAVTSRTTRAATVQTSDAVRSLRGRRRQARRAGGGWVLLAEKGLRGATELRRLELGPKGP